jgi:hypothetical protein
LCFLQEVQSCLSCLGMLWAKHDSCLPFWHLMVPGKQLETSWCFLCPVQSCLSGLGMLWVKHDSFWPLWHMLRPAASSWSILGVFFAQVSHVWVACGPNTTLILAILAHVSAWQATGAFLVLSLPSSVMSWLFRHALG